MNFNTITAAIYKQWLPKKLLLAMKLTTLMLLFVLFKANASFSQITLNERNASLEKVLKTIKRQTGYAFFYDNKDVRLAKITLDVDNVPLETVLKEFSKQLPLDFKIVGKTVLLKRKESHISIGSPNLPVKIASVVKGKVLDDKGLPIPGVNVFLTGNNFSQGTASKENGDFSFNVPSNGSYTLSASYIGFNKFTQVIEVAGSTVTKNITLNPATQDLNEVMVVAYGKQTRASFTGSAKEIKGPVINGAPRASLQESLQGNVAGVVSTNGSGQPGAVPNVRIRGIGSVSAGSGPLYVVDGIPIDAGQVSGLNNYDVESVTVLKDASAASIYGSRAANGVVLVTTKSGKVGKTVVSASLQSGVNNIVQIKGS